MLYITLQSANTTLPSAVVLQITLPSAAVLQITLPSAALLHITLSSAVVSHITLPSVAHHISEYCTSHYQVLQHHIAESCSTAHNITRCCTSHYRVLHTSHYRALPGAAHHITECCSAAPWRALLLGELIGEPVQALVQPLPLAGARRLDVPL